MKGRRTRKQQLTAIAAIIVGVFAISIGFAAFSSTLNIRSSATVNPDASTFAVIFSKDGNSIDATQTVNPSSETYGDAATITNGTSPVIGGLKAKFTSPGQSVSYSFYAKNTGSYDAYLNYITFLNAEGATSNKICTAQDGTDQTMVDSACNGISISVKVGSDEAVTTSQAGITNHMLAKNTNEQVIVTITYAENSALADGAFDVSFGDVSLIYSSINNYVVEETPIPGVTESLCTANTTKATALVWQNGDPLLTSSYVEEEVGLLASTDGAYTPGVAYTCNFIDASDENNMTFFVLSSTEDTVTLISGANLGETVAWSEDGNNHKDESEDQQAVTAKVALAERISNWSNANGGKLSETQMLTIKLPTAYQIAEAAGQTFNGSYISEFPTWLYSYTKTPLAYGYWTSTPYAGDSSRAWYVYYMGYVDYNDGVGIVDFYGIRPVITISKDQIG